VGDDGGDEFPGERRSDLVTLRFGEVTLQDGVGRTLPEVGLEDRGERESTSGPSPSRPVSLRRHRR
jgi:hypothetical protein